MGKGKKKKEKNPMTESWKRYKKDVKELLDDIILEIAEKNGDRYSDYKDYKDSVTDLTWDFEEKK